jgi:hypothetical protein
MEPVEAVSCLGVEVRFVCVGSLLSLSLVSSVMHLPHSLGPITRFVTDNGNM